MENVRNFLESSTIHGLAYIATGRKYARLFWILVVISGFTGAGVMIYQSIESWNESPVKTTIETLPITEITFPSVTVCPPKNSYTDLNYDLMMAENMTLDNDTRHIVTNYAMELLYDQLYDDMMRNMSKFEESNWYYNWYHGYTEIRLPSDVYGDGDGVMYFVYTAASSGSVTTQYFGEEFDAEKVETDINYYVYVYPPASVWNNTNVTLHLDIEKVTLQDLSSGGDTLYVEWIIMETSHMTYNYTPPTPYTNGITLGRAALPGDVKKQNLDMMPGFRVKWHYSGMEVEPRAKYRYDPSTMAFIRNCSNNIPFSVSITE